MNSNNSYFLKYIKYKTKYFELKKLKNIIFSESSNIADKENIHIKSNITRTPSKSTEIINPLDIQMDNYIDTFFKTYNLITWGLDKLYLTPESNTELKEFCSNLNTLPPDPTNPVNSCDNPEKLHVESELESKVKAKAEYEPYPYTNSSCCNFKGTIISKRYVHRFNTGSEIVKDNINLEFIKFFPKIETPDLKDIVRKNFISYLRSLVIESIQLLKTEKFKERFYEILEDNDIEPETGTEYSDYQINKVIESDDFLGLDDILELIYRDDEYKQFEQYQKLLTIKSRFSVIDLTHSIQSFENKLFKQINLDGSNTFYFYFSFGTLNFIEQMDWEKSLKIYIEEIKKLLSDQSAPVKAIVLAGHSVGSIVIQHLATQLLINGIDISKIFLIGSGCRMDNILSDSQILDIHSQYANRYFFIISGYIRDEKIYYDHRSSDLTNKVNKINTHFIICSNILEYPTKLSNYKCDSTEPTILEIIDHDLVNRSENFIPNPNPLLHEFGTYSQYYLS